MNRPLIQTGAFLCCLAYPAWGFAAQDQKWRQCHTPAAPPVQSDSPIENENQPTRLSADRIVGTDGATSLLEGDVLLIKGSRTVQAERMKYNQASEDVDASGNVRFRRKDMLLQADRMKLNLKTDSGNLDNVSFQIPRQHGRGSASSIRLDNADLSHLRDMTYTTCDPGDDGWSLEARNLTLDQESGFGTATHTWLRIQDVPVFYMPWVRFPIDERRLSGFLMPGIGYDDDTGRDISLPFYWNIAPNLDATLTPRLTSKRGGLLTTEFRYLTQNHSGEITAEYLPDDKITREDRGLFAYRHRGKLGEHWSDSIYLDYMSDPDYAKDLKDSAGLGSTTHMERRVDLQYKRNNWSLLTRAQGYQTIDPAIAPSDRPYQRLPQISLSTNRQWDNGSQVSFASELVRFEHETKIRAIRLNLEPTVSRSWSSSWGYLTPALRLRHTSYQTDQTAAGDEFNRTLPTFSLDSGVFFERSLEIGANRLTQTLEPRLFYLYTPYEDQSNIPVFDSGNYGFSYAQLFRTDRFSGVDRVGDAQQLSLGLSSKFRDQQSGTQYLSASIGQIFYLKDRRVTLPGESVQTTEQSDIVAEANANIGSNWTLSTQLQWDQELDKTRTETFTAQYRTEAGNLFNYSHRFERDSLEQADISARWRISPRWHWIGRKLYSIRDQVYLDNLVGLEYESCCWGVTIVARRERDNASTEADNSIRMQFELKGLASVGRRIGQLLQDDIPGYPN